MAFHHQSLTNRSVEQKLNLLRDNILKFLTTMSIVDHSSQVTDVSYQTIESNLKWEIRNPPELKSLVKSDKMRIPLINREW